MHTIKELREKAGITQLMLAERLGIERSTVAKWEAGVSLPNAAKLPAIADVLGCNISDLFQQDRAAE